MGEPVSAFGTGLLCGKVCQHLATGCFAVAYFACLFDYSVAVTSIITGMLLQHYSD